MATSIVETITPQKAQEYLAKSGGNRNISKPVVRSYANSMKEGKWLKVSDSFANETEFYNFVRYCVIKNNGNGEKSFNQLMAIMGLTANFTPDMISKM